MPLWVTFLLVAFFLAMNAFFVISEFAMVRVRPSQVEMAVQEGVPGSWHAKQVTDNVNAYLSACQLGITLASLALGWLGEPAFSELIRPGLSLIGMPDVAISGIAVAIGYFIMTTLHVVVGELVPKSFAIFATGKSAMATARPLFWFYRITYPIMWLFNHLTNAIMHLAGHDAIEQHEAYTGEELKLLIDESTASGLIDPEANEIVDNIFDIGMKDAEAIMTPRTDLVCVDVEDSLEDNLKVIQGYKFTRYPVCRGSKDRIIGFVHVKDLYTAAECQTVSDLPIRTIEAVPESIPVAKLLQMLQAKRTKIAVVVDEHGGTSGIVTMSDIMEQIVGRTQDEYVHGEGGRMVRLSDTCVLIDGQFPIDETIELIGFAPEEAAECETAGGLLLELFDRIPDAGDCVGVADPSGGGAAASFTVTGMDNHRIDKIQVDLTPARETRGANA